MKRLLGKSMLLIVALLLSGCGDTGKQAPQQVTEESSPLSKGEKTQESTGSEERAVPEGTAEIETETETEPQTYETLAKSPVYTQGAPSIPPEETQNVSVVISKTDHTLTLYSGEDVIATYRVGLAKNPVGAKEIEGDKKNPEGEYYVCNKNSQSQYHLALGLSYPGKEDALRGYASGLITEAQRDSIIGAIEKGEKPDWYTPLGGEIMIHGQKGDKGSATDWTRGCFAMDNEDMDRIWDYIPVGAKVTIQK